MLKIYLMRHCEAEDGDELDPTRSLTKLGKKQARMMAKWFARQTEKPELLLQSNMERSQRTAKHMENHLELEAVTTSALDPDVTPANAWHEILRLGNAAGVKSVLAISHGPLLPDLLAYLTGSDSPHQFHFAHGAIAHVRPPDTDDIEDSKQRARIGRGKELTPIAFLQAGRGILHWIVTPNVVARDQDELDKVTSDATAAVEAALRYADAAIAEAQGDYTYDEVEMKRWNLGAGGKSGENCETCEENADRGWIDMDDTFLSSDGDDIDTEPAHPNCSCTVEFQTKRVRVYESGRRVVLESEDDLNSGHGDGRGLVSQAEAG
jgi:phosphohistidine phosphatase